MTFDPVTFHEESRDVWGAGAPDWEERRAWLMDCTAAVNDWLVEKAAPLPGQTVLELAAGTGDLGFAAADRIGTEGSLISTDFAPEMVEVARRVAAARGLTSVDHRVMDAAQMDLGDDTVDAVLCRWAFMLMADPVGAFTETRRVLRDGGRLALAVWTWPDRNPWVQIPGMTLVQRGHMRPPGPEEPGIFALADPERLIALLTTAGFSEPEIEEITFDFVYPDFDSVWDTTNRLTRPLAEVVRKLSDDERRALRDAIEDGLGPYRQENGSYAVPASTWVAVAS